jgi:uncharacterized protein (TIGR02246 family)
MVTPAASPVDLSDAEKAAIVSLTQRVVTAWSQHDAEAFAGVFTEDGTMILPGLYKKGRPQISAYMAAAFKGAYKGTQVTGTPLALRRLGRDAAVLISMGGVLRSDESEVSEKDAVHAMWVAVRKGGAWQLAAYQNSPKAG